VLGGKDLVFSRAFPFASFASLARTFRPVCSAMGSFLKEFESFTTIEFFDAVARSAERPLFLCAHRAKKRAWLGKDAELQLLGISLRPWRETHFGAV
jgi:hypothetical protein